jgi:miniconductance mechanosensitive channel
MRETGARRIKRSLLIDQTSIRFCDEEMIEKYEGIHLLKPYIKAKRKELEQADIPFGVSGGDDHLPLNHRALTNLGTFRAYIVAYLRKNLKIHQDLTIMVRQLPPTPEGIPLEVYCFYDDTDWVKYEGIQADIFDHLLAILPYFDLKVFQIPTGLDFRTLKE